MGDGSVLIVGGTGGLGREVARHYQRHGAEVVVTGRDAALAGAVAAGLGDNVSGLGVDLAEPGGIRDALASVGPAGGC